MKLKLSIAAFALSLTAQSQATVITYTDLNAWQLAINGAVQITEDFNGNSSSFSANSSGNSIGNTTTLDLIGGIGDTGPTGITGNGFFEGEVDSSSFENSDGLSLQFNTPDILGFGFLGLQNDNINDPEGLDLEEIGIDIDGEQFLISDILGLTNSSDNNLVESQNSLGVIPFIGFISDVTISSFSLLHGDFVAPGEVLGGNEEFYIDGLVLAKTEVPEPASILLLGLGFIGLSLSLLKRS